MEHSTGLHVAFIVVRTPRKDCEEEEPSPNSKEKNLGSFKGLATDRFQGTVCRVANMELEFQPALEYTVV